MITHDDLWPRDAEHRYRLYVVRDDEREVLAASPTMEGIGLAIRTIHDDCKEVDMRLFDLGKIGVLDAVAHEWILLPWSRRDWLEAGQTKEVLP